MILIWDSWNKEHIKKHNVEVIEVEEACKASSKIIIKSYLGRTVILSTTNKGRLLTVVGSQDRQKELYVVSTRDMSKKERRIYREQNKAN